jgi:glycosyltransferase involved in cell wall biosynthesis
VKIVWSLPVRGERLTSSRGDLVRARSLIDALRADGHEVIVVEDAAQVGMHAAVFTYRTVLRSLLSRRIALILRDIGRAAHGWLHGLRVAVTARRTRADLIIETQVACAISGALAAWLTGIPLVLDDCSPAAEESAFGIGVPALPRVVLAMQARSARSVVAVSPALADMLAGEGIPREKLVCVPNGVSVKAFETAAGESWRSNYTLQERCVVGFVGSFQPWHRVELLIEAVAALPADLRIHVVLGGEGRGLESVLGAAASRGLSSVTAVGAVQADLVPSLLAACDIGVLPHTNAYGDPMKLREYAAAGIPSVAPDVEPVREVIEHNVTGLLFPLGNAQGLAGALARLAADPALRSRLGKEARHRAFESGSWTERSRALLAAAARGSRSGGVPRSARRRSTGRAGARRAPLTEGSA